MQTLKAQDLIDSILKLEKEFKRPSDVQYIIQTASGKYIPVQRLSPFYPDVTKEQLERALTNYRDPETGETLQGSTIISIPMPNPTFNLFGPLKFDWQEEPLRKREEDDKVTE